MQTDDAVDQEPAEPSLQYKLTFLGIFAVPALIDISLLSTIGRGLYLTTYMSDEEKTSATTALLLALLTCGGIGGWISSGGSYYLFANAFPAMNLFVLTRFVAGLGIVLIGGVVGLITFAVKQSSITAGIVFLFYFCMLSTYLTTLSALSIYQVPGTDFLSGRTAIMSRIPILFISPILTIWVQHDIVVYPCVLTIFLVSLLWGARDVLSKWTTWYLDIPTVADTDIIEWYLETSGTEMSTDEVGISSLPREAFLDAILKERARSSLFRRKRSRAHHLIVKMAAGYDSTQFLMRWFCSFTRTRLPMVYSSSWNLTLRAGIERMTNMQKGLRLHSAFLHWRRTGLDIWCAILYFVVALLDKWAALFSGQPLVGLSEASSAEFRLAVGFGLCYYLIGAVTLDAVSQPLWSAANKVTMEPISSLDSLQKLTRNDKSVRRRLYWQNLCKFFFFHLWGMASTSAVMWCFGSGKNSTIMYLSYLGAYTGLLWYQYNKIYCGTRAAEALSVATVVGLPIGIALHKSLDNFAYSGVLCLAVGTWLACIHSLWLSEIGWSIPFFKKHAISQDSTWNCKHDSDVAFSSSTFDADVKYSASTMEKLYYQMDMVGDYERLSLLPLTKPGSRVMSLLESHRSPMRLELIEQAFPTAFQMIATTIDLWSKGGITVDITTIQNYTRCMGGLSTVARKCGDRLHIIIAVDLSIGEIMYQLEGSRYLDIIAESMVQATAEHFFGLSHEDSIMAQILLQSGDQSTPSIPESIKFRMETSSVDRSYVLGSAEKTILHHLLFKLECDTEWESLPATIRAYLIKRCCGERIDITAEQEDWILSRCSRSENLGVAEIMARCTLQAYLSASIKGYVQGLSEEGHMISPSNPSFEDQCQKGLYSSSSSHHVTVPERQALLYLPSLSFIKVSLPA